RASVRALSSSVGTANTSTCRPATPPVSLERSTTAFTARRTSEPSPASGPLVGTGTPSRSGPPGGGTGRPSGGEAATDAGRPAAVLPDGASGDAAELDPVPAAGAAALGGPPMAATEEADPDEPLARAVPAPARWASTGGGEVGDTLAESDGMNS